MALVYAVTAAAVVDKDVLERRLSVSVNGQVRDNLVFSSETVDFGEVKVDQNDQVILTLVDVDDVGNVSKPAVLEFVAADTLPPSEPGSFGVNLVREE